MSQGPARAGLVPAREFPGLAELCYLNTASIGLMSVAAQFAAEQMGRRLGLYGTTCFDEEAEVAALDCGRAAAAGLLGVPPAQLAIVTSVSEALSQIAWSLRPPAGANVVSADLEFPSVVYPWMRVARESGAEVRLVRAAADPGSLSLEAVAELVDADTAAICLSHVQYATGYRFDLAALGELAAAHDAWLVVDASQSLGAVEVDLRRTPVDALVCAGYKWLCGPFGAALCHVGPRLAERLDPPFVGWKSSAEPYAMVASRLRLADSPLARMELSTMAYGAGAALAVAIERIEEVGAEAIEAHNRSLGEALGRGLESLGAELLCTGEAGHGSGILSARFPGRDGERVAAWLNESGVVVSPRLGSTRFSVHLYNRLEDVALALDVLDRVLERGGPVEPPRRGWAR